MKRNLIPLLLLPVLAVTACNSTAKNNPSDYDGPIVTVTGDKIHNNIMNIIYDAKMESGTVSKEVLNSVLFELSNSIYGTYEEVIAAKADDAKMTKLIDAHKVYQVTDAEGKRVAAKEKIRFQQTAQRIEDRIANKFFDAIKGGSFTRDGRFYEEDYLMSLRSSLKKVADPSAKGVTTTKGLLILPEFEGKDVFTKGILHVENYNKGENTYLSTEIVPEVYRDLLVEQYLFDANYNSIGRAYGRNVNIVSITNRTDSKDAASKLMNAYIDTYINSDKAWTQEEAPLQVIAEAWKGYELGTAKEDGTIKEKAASLLGEKKTVEITADHLYGTVGNMDYYEGTSYGKLVKDLSKVYKNAEKTDKTIESDLTNNGEYTVEKGFAAKTDKIQQEDYITDGWHIRNGGLSSLDTEMRTRLFNINVANALDNEDYPDRFTEADGKVVYSNHPSKENPYVAKIHGRYFLKKSNFEKQDDTSTRIRDILWFDKATGTYSIVEINQAVSSSKLSKAANSKNYENIATDKIAGFANMEEIAHAVAQEIAKGESYSSLSTKHWLKEASLAFNDDRIEKYFKDNYPEIFKEK